MVVVTTTEAVPAAAGADAVGEFAESLVAVSELEQADRISAEVARTPRSAIFFVVMMSM
jgi:hypothetical protein